MPIASRGQRQDLKEFSGIKGVQSQYHTLGHLLGRKFRQGSRWAAGVHIVGSYHPTLLATASHLEWLWTRRSSRLPWWRLRFARFFRRAKLRAHRVIPHMLFLRPLEATWSHLPSIAKVQSDPQRVPSPKSAMMNRLRHAMPSAGRRQGRLDLMASISSASHRALA